MTKQDKQYYIYIRSTRERIPVTKEEFDNYYRDINTFRRKQTRHGRCVCPKGKWLYCDMDCATCPFRKAGDHLSYDCHEDADELSWDDVSGQTRGVEDFVADSQQMAEILKRLNELMPDAVRIGLMRQQGMDDVAISVKIGIPRQTFNYQIRKASKVLQREFPDLF